MTSTITPEKCAEIIEQSGNIVALSGAGISTAAGIPDFRGPNGLYSTGRYDPETVFDINFFMHNQKPFYDFSRDLLSVVKKLSPTFTHFFLAELERAGKIKALITQNIDPLHQLAGSKNIICLHGNYATTHCLECNAKFNLQWLEEKILSCDIPHCPNCKGIIKPDVVFFGEAVNGMQEAGEYAEKSELMLVLGSSLTVYPAALLPQYAPRVIVVNSGESHLPPGKERYLADCDLDSFFRKTAEYLNIRIDV